jgi:hypothetical protein
MTGTAVAPRRYYQRDWVPACRDATRKPAAPRSARFGWPVATW